MTDHMNTTAKMTAALLENYELQEEVIVQGKFGGIRRCFNKGTGEEAVCKTVRKSAILRHNPLVKPSDLNNEINMMQRVLGHPAIVSLHDSYEDEEYIHLVMEMCSVGNLFHRIFDSNKKPVPFSEEEAAITLQKLMEAISYCHSLGIAHRDIKPENILFAKNSNSLAEIKLSDFGDACSFSPAQPLIQGMVGTPYYMAPEVLLEKYYSEKVDVWSAGVTAYLMLSGQVPFRGKTIVKIFEAVKSEHLCFPSDRWSSISESAKDLISRMLSRDVTKRLTAQQVLEHPWITTHVLRKPT